MNPITLQIISNAIVLLGVLVAIGTIIYNVRTAKKTQTANFLFESRQDMQYIESVSYTHLKKKSQITIHHTCSRSSSTTSTLP
ncbi:DUF4760 domain-containing protein, partial [Escherichia coli]